MKHLMALCSNSLFMLILLGSFAVAQMSGLPAFSPIHSDGIDNVKIRDGGILIELPVRQKSALIPFSYSLATQVTVTTNGAAVRVSGIWGPSVWVSKVSPTVTGYDGYYGSQFASYNPSQNLSFSSMQFTCNGQQTTQYYAFTYTDPLGSSHFIGQPPNGTGGIYWDTLHCLGPQNYSAWTQDGQYYVTSPSTGFPTGGSAVDTGGDAVETLHDTNGNIVSWTGSGNQYQGTLTWSDSTGATPLIQTQTTTGYLIYPGNHIITDTHGWTDENGNTQSYTLTYSPYTQQTHFSCTSYPDVPPTAQYYPSSISTPDGQYTITYEPTPGAPNYVTGRIAKIVFPSGASIQYSYTGGTNNSGLLCTATNDPGAFLVPLLTRTLTDTTGKTRVWKYNTTAITNSTVVTDPNGNDTVYGFALEFNDRLAEAYSIKSYQGSYSAGTLLKTVTNCYNATLPCNTVPPNPFTDLQVYITIPGLPQYLSEDTTFEGQANVQGFPLPIEKKVYDTNGTLLTDTNLTYGSYSGGSCTAISTTIVNRVCTSVTTDSGGHIASQVRNTYDTRGNMTASSQWVSGTNWLTRYITPNSNGTTASTTDVNGTVTNYTYNACDGTFPTQVSIGTLTTNMTWNCGGGVMMSRTDANGQTTSFDYKDYTSGVADPWWRLKSTTDPLGYVTTGTYTPTTFERSLVFNSNSSAVDVLTTSDGFGRSLLTQTRQFPGAGQFDTVSTGYEQSGVLVSGYDGNGNAVSNSQPCVSAADVGCPSTPSTTQTYDGLNRPLVTTDGGGGTVAKSYPQIDVLEVVGPAPSGEHAKSHQYEYDGLGRLTSVCEILSTGGTSCGQKAAASGYKTSYAYSVPSAGGSQLVVTQGAQTRTYVHDGLANLAEWPRSSRDCRRAVQVGDTMRILQILLLAQVMSIVAVGQDHSSLIGQTRDCFAGKITHPAQVNIYLLDPLKSPAIAAILTDMDRQVPRGNDQNVDAFFASYERLTSAIRKTNILMQVQSNEDGRFSFRGLKAGTRLVLLGLAEREDEPAYYAYIRLKLRPGKNSVTLDFDRGVACKSP